jgi:hypothetical protein
MSLVVNPKQARAFNGISVAIMRSRSLPTDQFRKVEQKLGSQIVRRFFSMLCHANRSTGR